MSWPCLSYMSTEKVVSLAAEVPPDPEFRFIMRRREAVCFPLSDAITGAVWASDVLYRSLGLHAWAFPPVRPVIASLPP